MSTQANFDGPDAAAVSPALEQTLAPHQEKPPQRAGLSATTLLIIVNAVIFYAMLAHSIYITGWEKFGNTLLFAKFDSELLLSWGSDFGPLTLTGQFWRVLTARFLHFNFPHLAFNMLFLWGLGRPLGRLFTRAQLIGIYLLTAAAGSVWSLYWHPLMYSVGASGAIYGLGGVWIALLAFGRLGLPRRTVIGILVWLFFLTPVELLRGNMFKDTNYAAHAGGIVSGLVIGLLLAPSFRPPMERSGRQYGVLRSAAVTLILLFAVVTQARKDTVSGYLNDENILWTSHSSYSPHPPRIARVFLDLKGDPKLVRHFTSLLNTELESAGIAVAGSEQNADGVLRGELKSQIEHVDLSMGVVKMYINSRHGLQTIDSCRNLSMGGNSNLYERSAAGAASDIRQRYHDARTVRLDPASDMAASRQFAAEFPSELKTSGLTMVQSGPADIALYITLLTQKVPVEEDEAAYHIKVVSSDGGALLESSGNGVLSARLVGNTTAACPARLADLGWIYNDNTLSSIAHNIANDLQAAPRIAKPSKAE